MYLYVTRMPILCQSNVIRMSLVCTCISFMCHTYVIRMHSYVIRMSLVCTGMSFEYHLNLLVCHSYVSRMYTYVISYITRMSLVCTFMSLECLFTMNQFEVFEKVLLLLL